MCIEKNVIINTISPFIIKKYIDLIDWGKKKTYRNGVPLEELIFEKKDKDSNWSLTLVGLGISTNSTTFIIKNVLYNHIKKFAMLNNVIIDDFSTATMHTPNETYQYIIHKVKNI